MSYCKRKTYKIKPKTSYKVLRNCANCGGKTEYVNTDCFRVNANGNRIDVWLIYQCEKCKHPCNLTVYERVNPKILKEQYPGFLGNDKELALQYGTNKSFFQKNKAEISMDGMEYEILEEETEETETLEENSEIIHIQNPYELKLRTDKVLAEIFQISRRKINQLVEQELILVQGKYLERVTEVISKKRK
ncbi:MAG: DUF1062 domain-containing protein [Lachnospiraceae bacterium]|nr:DUF1062 domain-containing protein [Lachnospiraceae bacterium]